MTAVAPGWLTFRRWQLARAAEDRARFLRCWREWRRRDFVQLVELGRRMARWFADLARKLMAALRPMVEACAQFVRQLGLVPDA